MQGVDSLPWTDVGVGRTDSNGRITHLIADDKSFPVGLHTVQLTSQSDPNHQISLNMAVVPVDTEAVVFSIDGSFAASLSILGKVSVDGGASV